MSNSEDMTTSQQATNVGQAQDFAPGTFCWWELSTTDTEGAKAFYTSLLGWTAIDTPITGGVYTMLQMNGKDVGALHQLMPELKAQGVPPHWLAYVSVADVDDTAAKVGANGGTVVAPPFDVMEYGRMAVVQDPSGGTLALWQPRAHKGAGHVGDVGGVCWNELGTKNAATAGPFYKAVFGWEPNEQQMGPMTYTMFMNGTTGVAGMMQISAEWGPHWESIPSNWMLYFSVADCDATIAKATELGATLIVPAMDVEGVGRMATFQDPQGAMFSVVQLVG